MGPRSWWSRRHPARAAVEAGGNGSVPATGHCVKTTRPSVTGSLRTATRWRCSAKASRLRPSCTGAAPETAGSRRSHPPGRRRGTDALRGWSTAGGVEAAAWNIHAEALERQAGGQDVIVLSVGDPDFRRRSSRPLGPACNAAARAIPRSPATRRCGCHRRASRAPLRPAGHPGPGGRARGRPVRPVRGLPMPAGSRRRRPGAEPMRHLPGDGRRGGAPAAARPAGAERGFRSTSTGWLRRSTRPSGRSSTPQQPDRGGDDPARARGGGRSLPAPRPLADLRRGLRLAALRGRARGPGRPARHGRAHRDHLEPVQVARHDRLARGLAGRPPELARHVANPGAVHALRLVGVRPGRGHRGADRRARGGRHARALRRRRDAVCQLAGLPNLACSRRRAAFVMVDVRRTGSAPTPSRAACWRRSSSRSSPATPSAAPRPTTCGSA